MTDTYNAMNEMYKKRDPYFVGAFLRRSTLDAVYRLVWIKFKKYVSYCKSHGHEVRYSILYSIFLHSIEHTGTCNDIENISSSSFSLRRAYKYFMKIWTKA